VYGVKGDYARRSFHLKSAMEVGLPPYNQTEVPAGSPFIYKALNYIRNFVATRVTRDEVTTTRR